MSKKVLIPIADGTEEIEAVTAIDLFRRADFQVTVAGEIELVKCSRGVILATDALISNIDDDYDLIYIPGGAVGTENLSRNHFLVEILKRHKERNGNIAAICAAPKLLLQHSLLEENANVTSHPSVENLLTKYNYSQELIVEHNGIYTSRGAGTAMIFVLYLIERLESKEVADNIAQSILFER